MPHSKNKYVSIDKPIDKKLIHLIKKSISYKVLLFTFKFSDV